jgi:N-acyl-D-amino-acid deacylase
MTGTAIPSLSAIDDLVSNFMATYKVPGGAVGFVRDGKLLFVRGYGYADTNTQELVQPDSIFRLASLSKAVTAAAILKLVEQGRLTLDQPALEILNYPAPTYPGATIDPRLASITIRQLLNHTGGWNRNTAVNPDGGTGFDPTVNWTVRAAADMGMSEDQAPRLRVTHASSTCETRYGAVRAPQTVLADAVTPPQCWW